MPTTSTVQTVKAKLVELLDAAQPDSVPVLDAPPDDALKRCNFIGVVHDLKNTYPVIRAGRKPRQETYIVNVHLRAHVDGHATANDARQLVMDDLAKLENTIANDPALGLTATIPTLVTEIHEAVVGMSPPPNSRRAECVVQVRASARLS